MTAPLDIEGYAYERMLGAFSLGSSYLYRELARKRTVQVLLAHDAGELESFLAAFSEAVGSVSAEIILYAGTTDLGRPYLVSDFIDDDATADEDATAGVDATAGEDALVEETVLSSRRSDDETRLSSRPVQPKEPPARRDSLVVSERLAVIPDPSSPADQPRYAPRTLPAEQPTLPRIDTGERPFVMNARLSSSALEKRRARTALTVIVGSLCLSVAGVVALIAIFVSS